MFDTEAVNHRPAAGQLRTLFVLAAIVLTTCAILGVASAWFDSTLVVGTVATCGLLLLVLYGGLAWAQSRQMDTAGAMQVLVFLIWWFLLVSDELFDRLSDIQNSLEGQFSADAYSEVVTWLLAALLLSLIVLPRLDALRHMFSGSFRWLTLFTLACIVSVLYAPSPLYALGWAFKLSLVVIVLRACASTITSPSDVQRFFWVTFWGLLIITFLPVTRSLADPTTLFEGVGGRLNADPVVLSGMAGCLLLVTLMLNTLRRNFQLLLVACLSITIMIFAFGKTCLIAGVVSAILYFLLQKKVGSGLVLLGGVILIAAVLLTTVKPLAIYLKFYRSFSTFTGRTEIWTHAIAGIRQRPLLGHGYLSSHFMWTTGRGFAASVAHLHNGFLEVSYNNGLAGLTLVLLMHAAIVSNLVRARSQLARLRTLREQQESVRQAYVLTVGCIALYVNLLISGLFTVAFGGRATSNFMLFLSLLVISEVLHRWSRERAQASPEPLRSFQIQPATTPATT